jgi:hypothetical protein
MVAEVIDPYGLCLSALVTPEQVEEKAATVVKDEPLPTIKTFGCGYLSHNL